MASYGHTFTSGDTVTPTKLNNARAVSEIVNADISATAAIAGTKIAPNFGAQDITVSTADRSITNTGNFALSFGTNNTERLRIGASGNVGIGIATPQRRLQSTVTTAPAGTLSAKTGLLIQNLDGTGTSGSPNSAAIQFAYDPASPRGYIESGTFGLDFMAFGFETTERLRIDASGNVGIGTVSPAKRLDVQAIGSNAVIRLKETNTYGVNWDIDVGTSNAMTFKNDGITELSYRFLNGGVCIGTSSLGGRLTVTPSSGGNAVEVFQNTSSIAFSSSPNRTNKWFIGANISDAGNFGLVFGSGSTTLGSGATHLTIKSTGQVRFQPLASDPEGAEAGDVYYNSGSNKLKVYNGSSWVDLH